MTKLEVSDPGFFTTVQDLGRPGYRKFGIPVSGVMDEGSMMLANQLVGNPEDYPVLELTIKGGKYRFHTDAVIALTGAEVNATLDGEIIPQNEVVEVSEGNLLEIGYFIKGCRACLAVRGMMKLAPVMGSFSTYTTGHFGGFQGRALATGDMLEWAPGKRVSVNPMQSPVTWEEIHELKVMEGPEWEVLRTSTKEKFLHTRFTVSSKSNRMGIRLEGDQLNISLKDMRSSPVLPGVIQLPPDGNPIILMKDGQTIGGYPRIAILPKKELWKAAQLRPGDTLEFSFTG